MRTHIEINVQTGERTERPYTAEEDAAADALIVAPEPLPELTPAQKLAAAGLTVEDLKALLKE
jgi:hypothetical protein